jgi:hypothetical protein
MGITGAWKAGSIADDRNFSCSSHRLIPRCRTKLFQMMSAIAPQRMAFQAIIPLRSESPTLYRNEYHRCSEQLARACMPPAIILSNGAHIMAMTFATAYRSKYHTSCNSE